MLDPRWRLRSHGLVGYDARDTNTFAFFFLFIFICIFFRNYFASKGHILTAFRRIARLYDDARFQNEKRTLQNHRDVPCQALCSF